MINALQTDPSEGTKGGRERKSRRIKAVYDRPLYYISFLSTTLVLVSDCKNEHIPNYMSRSVPPPIYANLRGLSFLCARHLGKRFEVRDEETAHMPNCAAFKLVEKNL